MKEVQAMIMMGLISNVVHTAWREGFAEAERQQYPMDPTVRENKREAINNSAVAMKALMSYIESIKE